MKWNMRIPSFAAAGVVFLTLAACGITPPPGNSAVVALSLPSTGPVMTPPPAPLGSPEADVVVPIDPQNGTWGSRTALVTIVEFSDFQCPYCERAFETMASVKAAYGPDQVRLVFKNNP